MGSPRVLKVSGPRKVFNEGRVRSRSNTRPTQHFGGIDGRGGIRAPPLPLLYCTLLLLLLLPVVLLLLLLLLFSWYNDSHS